MEKMPYNGCFMVREFLSAQEQQTILSELRDMCIREPQKYKLMKPQPPSEYDLEREETQGSVRPYVDKQNCYSMEVTQSKQSEVPEVLRMTVPLAIEAATKGSHNKAHYKRFRFDFYKPGGVSKQCEKVVMKQEKRKAKAIMTYFCFCLGDSLDLEFKMADHSFKRTLESGSAIFID